MPGYQVRQCDRDGRKLPANTELTRHNLDIHTVILYQQAVPVI
ncbi:hypothetical protein [Proteus mirabilis]